jgi:alkylation response protein AidB-like acyl-CoA dehydrogenase
MEFDLDETEKLLASSVEDAVARYIDPLVAADPGAGPVAADTIRELNRHAAAFGVFGARIPEEFGGTELSHVALGLVIERLPPFFAVSAIAQEATTFRFFHAAGEGLRERFLADLISGRLIAASAISEPVTGSDPSGVQTTAKREGETVHVRGAKLWITNGTIADVIVALARDRDSGELVRVLIDTRETPIEAREVPMGGLRRGHLSELTLDVRVPADQVLTATSNTRDALTRSWLANRPNMGLIACHIATRALEAAINYAKERRQFGRPIAAFQLIQGLLADMATEIDAARLLCYRALAGLDAGRRVAREAAMAKMFATEAAIRVVLRAQEVYGAYGAATEYPLDQWLRDARMLTYPDGTRQIQQLIIGRDLVGIPAFTDYSPSE